MKQFSHFGDEDFNLKVYQTLCGWHTGFLKTARIIPHLRWIRAQIGVLYFVILKNSWLIYLLVLSRTDTFYYFNLIVFMSMQVYAFIYHFNEQDTIWEQCYDSFKKNLIVYFFGRGKWAPRLLNFVPCVGYL